MSGPHLTSPPEGIEASELVKIYPGDIRALDGVSLTVAPGSIFGLLGPNGAGKSTTVKILSTLSRPTSGTARVAGHDVLRHPERVRAAIGVVGQRSAVDPERHRAREPRAPGPDVRHRGPRAADPHRRHVRAVRPRRRRRPAGRHLVGWHAAEARRGDGPDQPAQVSCSSTSRRPASTRSASRAVGRDRHRSRRTDGLTILLTTHYLEEADQLADAARDRRSRPDRRRRHARVAQGRAPGRRDPHRRRGPGRRTGGRLGPRAASTASRARSSTAPASRPVRTTRPRACPRVLWRSRAPESPSPP